MSSGPEVKFRLIGNIPSSARQQAFTRTNRWKGGEQFHWWDLEDRTPPIHDVLEIRSVPDNHNFRMNWEAPLGLFSDGTPWGQNDPRLIENDFPLSGTNETEAAVVINGIKSAMNGLASKINGDVNVFESQLELSPTTWATPRSALDFDGIHVLVYRLMQ